MKTLIAGLFLMLSCYKGYCQKQISSPLLDVKNKVASIRTYVNEVNTNPKLQKTYMFDNSEFKQFSIYTKIEYGISNYQTPWKVLKVVKTTQNVNTSYFKDGHLVCTNEISSLYDNYSNIKDEYFRNDSLIYSTHNVYKEHILEIQSAYNGAKAGGSYTLKINKDSIKYFLDDKLKMAYPTLNWNRLTELLNLTDFDRIQTTGFESYIDGPDLSYVITTDLRLHSFVNAPLNDPRIKKNG